MIHILKNFKLFKEFTDQELEKVSDIIEIRNYASGEFIIKQGEHPGTLFLLKDGTVRVSAKPFDAEAEEVYAILSPYEYFGELSLVDNNPTAADVVAEEDCVILAVDHDALKGLMAADLSISSKILLSLVQTLVQRLRDTDQSLSFARMLMQRHQ